MGRGKSSVVVIPHVKWKKQSCDPAFYPAADTDKFASLVKEKRGTLVFIPAKEDYGPTRQEQSDKEILMDVIEQLTETVNEN